jgi:hypothetical protein
MHIPPEQREQLRRHHNFADWQGAGVGGGRPIRGFQLKGDELPGWDLVKARRNATQDPPRLDTFWRRTGDTTDALLSVHVIESDSVAAAREALLEELGDFQSAAIVRRTDLDVGEVVFGHDLMLLFARGNLVVFVRNAGRQTLPVLEPARLLDAVLRELLRKAGEHGILSPAGEAAAGPLPFCSHAVAVRRARQGVGRFRRMM